MFLCGGAVGELQLPGCCWQGHGMPRIAAPVTAACAQCLHETYGAYVPQQKLK